MSNVSFNTERSLAPSYGENTTMKTHCSLPPTIDGPATWQLFNFPAVGGNTNTAIIGQGEKLNEIA